MNNQGTLYIVATPIGNLEDITQRALNTLKNADLIACEDTRHTGRLLAAYGIKNKMTSYHQHNENESTNKIITKLQAGENVALTSDAGTPLISDPGYPLVRECHKQNITVTPVVGACAVIALLSASGLPTNEFQFVGFLPAKSQAREKALSLLKSATQTTVLYESTHRISASLESIKKIIGKERLIAIGREMTKSFETIKLGTVSEISEFIKADSNQLKGEFVLAIAGNIKEVVTELQPEHLQLAKDISKELPPKKAAKIVANHFGIKSKIIYNALIQLD